MRAVSEKDLWTKEKPKREKTPGCWPDSVRKRRSVWSTRGSVTMRKLRMEEREVKKGAGKEKKRKTSAEIWLTSGCGERPWGMIVRGSLPRTQTKV